LISAWEIREMEQPASAKKAIEWFQAKYNQQLTEINDLFDKFRISEALMAIYKLVWDDFCSWYLEMVKPGYEQPIDPQTIEATKGFFENLLKLIHPFTPFIAEELWHLVRERQEGQDIIVAGWPSLGSVDQSVLNSFEKAEQVITNIRNVRKQNNIANKVKLELFVKKNTDIDSSFDSVVVKMGNLTQLEYVTEKVANSNSFLVESNEYFIPFGDSIDVEAETAKLKEELTYTQGFLRSVQGKLQNEKFMDGAPEQVVAVERKKEADALAKIAILEEKIATLS
jgi:valyl-tRNA synthetase